MTDIGAWLISHQHINIQTQGSNEWHSQDKAKQQKKARKEKFTRVEKSNWNSEANTNPVIIFPLTLAIG